MSEELTTKGKAAQEFGRMYVDALVQNAKLPAEPGYFTLRQDDLANIAAAAFEIGAQWRADVATAATDARSCTCHPDDPLAMLQALLLNPGAAPWNLAQMQSMQSANPFMPSQWDMQNAHPYVGGGLFGTAFGTAHNPFATPW